MFLVLCILLRSYIYIFNLFYNLKRMVRKDFFFLIFENFTIALSFFSFSLRARIYTKYIVFHRIRDIKTFCHKSIYMFL